MRPETEKAIETKFILFITLKDGKTKESSAKHAIESFKEVDVRRITEDVLRAYLFGVFGAICYDVTASLEARGVQRKETMKLWKETSQQEDVKSWITQAMSSTQT